MYLVTDYWNPGIGQCELCSNLQIAVICLFFSTILSFIQLVHIKAYRFNSHMPIDSQLLDHSLQRNPPHKDSYDIEIVLQ